MTTPDIRWTQRLVNFRRALATLQRAIGLAQSRPLSELEELGLIQAFEFTHELSWLLLKDFLVDQGWPASVAPAMRCVRRWCGSCCRRGMKRCGWR